MTEFKIECPNCGADNNYSPKDLLNILSNVECIVCGYILNPNIYNEKNENESKNLTNTKNKYRTDE